MPFQPLEMLVTARFNSKTSADFLDFYNSHLKQDYLDDQQRVSHKTLAPSSFRCSRISWFRLKGVTPDKTNDIDMSMEFKAEEGTAIHRIIQSRLKRYLGNDWVSIKNYISMIDYSDNVSDYVKSRFDTATLVESGLETQIALSDPPVRFAVDGLVRWNNHIILLEIKTCEYSSFQKLSEPKSVHIDQVKFYATLLGLSQVLFLYVDRQYGGIKSFELSVSNQDKQLIENKIQHIMKYIQWNICPEKLPDNDPWCTPSMCKYYYKCKQY